MKRLSITLFLVPALLLLLSVNAYAEDRADSMVPQEDLEKIQEAAPIRAPATPKNPRKLLVFSRLTGYRHKSAAWGAQALRVLGEKTGAYSPVLSDDPAMFDRQRLFEFDAVAFNNNCGNPVQDTQRRNNLLEFVEIGRAHV